MPTPPNPPYNFESLIEVVKSLLGPDGCPWDKQQTHQSLIRYCIEEAFEFAEAAESDDMNGMKDELGDLLFQVVLHSEIAQANGNYTLADVVDNITSKMIRRHPHVFEDNNDVSIEEVKTNWEKIKKQENKPSSNALDVQLAMPALMASHKIGERSEKIDFDFSDATEALAKVEEELNELKSAIKNNDAENTKEEIGDLLFSVSQLARKLEIEAEHALRQTNNKFINRVNSMFESAGGKHAFVQLARPQKEQYWKNAKK